MATSRRTATNENVSTYGDGTRDYTALATWEAATDIDLVSAAQSEVLECYDDAASFDDYTTLGGATTDASYFRIVRPASGEGHDGTSNNGVFFLVTSANNIFTINEDYSQIQDLILRHNVNTGSALRAIKLSGDYTKVIGCIIFDCTNAGAGDFRNIVMLGMDTILVHCLIENCEDDAVYTSPGAGNTCYIYNCTIIDSGDDGIHYSNGTCVCKNVLITGSAASDFKAGTYTGSDSNASGDATAPGTNNRINQTFTFANAAGNDYHLASSDAGAMEFGANLSADAFFAFDDDIDLDTRPIGPNWDIGFDEATGWIVPYSVVTRFHPAPRPVFFPRPTFPVKSRVFHNEIWRARHYVDINGIYRIFNAAEYRFYRKLNSAPVLGVDSSFATNATLPHEPVDTWADGTWYTSVTFFNGVIESGFLPLGPAGETAIKLVVSGGALEGSPPSGPTRFDLILLPDGDVRVHGIYWPIPDAGTNGPGKADEWSIDFTTDGSAPSVSTPTVTKTMTFVMGFDLLEHDITAADGQTVRVLAQTRRNDGTVPSPVWVYSTNSADKSIVADGTGPAAAGTADAWRGYLPADWV